MLIEKSVKSKLLKEIDALRDPQGFIKAGLPRFNRLFGRDSLITAWQLLDIDPSVCKATLKVLAGLQGKKSDPIREEEPGKILHETDENPHPEHPSTFPFPYYGSVDATPLFVIVASLYLEKTGDNAFGKGLWPHIKAAAEWLINRGDNDGFIEYERRGKGLLHQGWKDGTRDHLGIKPPVAIVEAQGYAYLALKKATALAETFGERSCAEGYDRRADKLKESFNQRFWVKEVKSFALALDGDKRQRLAITSNPGHLLFTGIVEEQYLDPLIKRMFAPDLWTPFGIRTLSTNDPDFDPLSYHRGSIWPHDNWIIAQGMKKVGAGTECEQIRSAILGAYQELGYIPELYGFAGGKIIEIPNACYPQAWAIGAVLNFLDEN